METSKKLTLLFLIVSALPYLSFLIIDAVCPNSSLYLLLPFAITIAVGYIAARDEIRSIKQLTDFAKELKDEKWSCRIEGFKSSLLMEVAEAFNLAADKFERKQNELRQVIDLVPGFIYAKDKSGKIILANKAFANFLNRTPQGVVGANVQDFENISFLVNTPFDDQEYQDDSLKSISEEECEKNGERFVYLVFKTPLISQDKQTLANLTFAYDITSIKEIQNNLETLNISLEARVKEEVGKNLQKDKELLKAKEKFIRNAVHEINTALTVITLNAEYLIKECGHSKSTSSILGAAKSLTSSYGDLSYFTLKDSTTYQRERSIDLSELIKERIEFFRDIAGLSDIIIASQIKPGAIIFSNEAKLTRLIDNNLSNAIKYSHPQKTIFIRFSSDENDIWTLEFESTGKAIEDKERIFELYSREDGIKGGARYRTLNGKRDMQRTGH